MKYIDIYQNLRPFHPEDEINGIICAPRFQPCCVCGRPTCYVEINYEGYFCSEECLQQFEDNMRQNEK